MDKGEKRCLVSLLPIGLFYIMQFSDPQKGRVNKGETGYLAFLLALGVFQHASF